MKNRQWTRGWHIEPKPAIGAIGLAVVLAMAGCAAGGMRGADRSGDEPLAAMNAGLRPTVLEPDTAPPGWSLQERMAHYKVPGVAVAVLKNGVAKVWRASSSTAVQMTVTTPGSKAIWKRVTASSF